jgi:hypothetical protein
VRYKKSRNYLLTTDLMTIAFPYMLNRKTGRRFLYFRKFIFLEEGPTSRPTLVSFCFMLSRLATAVARPEQLVRNAAHPMTRSEHAASGCSLCSSYILVYRFALSQAVGLSAQHAGS